MRPDEIIAFLKRQRFGVISSIGPTGEPQSAVVGLAFSDEGDAIFDTVDASRKARNLRRDPRGSLVLWEGERTVQMEGQVDEPTGRDREEILQVYLAVFPDGVGRLSWRGITHFRLRPSWVRYTDFDARPEPFVLELSAGFRMR